MKVTQQTEVDRDVKNVEAKFENKIAQTEINQKKGASVLVAQSLVSGTRCCLSPEPRAPWYAA